MESKSIIGKEPVYLFSTEHMPYTSRRDVGEVKWYGGDLEEGYKKNPHPIFGPEDIIYRFNRHGYRCPEFEMRNQVQENTIHVISLGCSATYGTGLPEHKTYPAVFKALLQNYLGRPVINWNLAMGGASSDYMVRTLTSAIPILKPDIVLLTFTGLERREYLNENAHVFNFTQGSKKKNRLSNKIRNPEVSFAIDAYDKLLSSYNNFLNLFKNYKVSEALCEQFKVMWLFSGFDVSIFEGMKHLIHTEKLVKPGLISLKKKYTEAPEIGLARDMIHPGIQPNKEHAEAFFERLQEVYASSLDKLKQG